jgi:hypothetical protein
MSAEPAVPADNAARCDLCHDGEAVPAHLGWIYGRRLT